MATRSKCCGPSHWFTLNRNGCSSNPSALGSTFKVVLYNMSAIANIIAFDGATTPVSHTLTPLAIARDKGEVVAEYRETGLATVPAYAQPRVAFKLARLKSGVYRTECRVAIPVMEAVLNQNAAGYTAAPKVAYENTVVISGFFHERSSVAERRLARQLAINIANGVSTSVTPVNTSAFAEMVDLLVMPT